MCALLLQSLCVCSKNRALKIKRDGWDAVLSIANTDKKATLRFQKTHKPAHMVLRFEDLDEDLDGYKTASVEQVQRILDFGRSHQEGKMLIHCEAGISRSTAAALAILAERFGPGFEAEALSELLRIKADAVPNLLVVRHADLILGRNGALVRVVSEWDATRQYNRWRRQANFMLQIGSNENLPPMPAEEILFEEILGAQKI